MNLTALFTCRDSRKGPAKSAGDRSSLRDLVPAAILLIAGPFVVSAVSLSASDSRGGHYFVVAAPGSSFGDTVELIGAAEGGLVAASRFQNVVIAASLRPDFAKSLRAAGAWLVVPSPLLAGCIGEQAEASGK